MATALLENGSTKLELGGDVYCIIPKDYKEPNYPGFFDTTRKANDDIQRWPVPTGISTLEQITADLSGDLSLVRKHAVAPPDNLNCIGDVLLYSALTGAHILKVTMSFEDFTENLNVVTVHAYNNILCIEGLDADVRSGTAGRFHITPDELFPVFVSAMAFNTTHFENVAPDSKVTCYFISFDLVRYLGMSLRSIGRFHFANGMLAPPA